MIYRITILLLVIINPILLNSQIGNIEKIYFDRREEIKEKKIESVIEYQVINREGEIECDPKRKFIKNKFLFDKDGNLIEHHEYWNKETFARVIKKYKHNSFGVSVAKTNINFTELGNVIDTIEWQIEFDSLNRKVAEISSFRKKNFDENGNVTGTYELDRSGNVRFEHLYSYDLENNLIDYEAWKIRGDQPDTLVHLISYEYKDDRLISMKSHSPIDYSKILKEKTYYYNSKGKLKKIIEEIPYKYGFGDGSYRIEGKNKTTRKFDYDKNNLLLVEYYSFGAIKGSQSCTLFEYSFYPK